ncbi:MAG: hypothetical protein Q4A71_01035 [Actinomycetaceae bacterium]|nr:hypothetical protein [Actinomycetaceae bacterium]
MITALVIALVVVLFVAIVAIRRARVLDSYHRRLEKSERLLELALARRAGAAVALARSAALEPQRAKALLRAAQAPEKTATFTAKMLCETELSAQIDGALAELQTREGVLVKELKVRCLQTKYIRTMHNATAVRCKQLENTRLARWLKLSGSVKTRTANFADTNE